MSKIDKYKLPKELDRRCILTKEQIDEMKELYQSGKYTQDELAKKYGISRMTVIRNVNDEFHKKYLAYQRRYGKKKPENRELIRESVRKTRAYKTELYEKGILK